MTFRNGWILDFGNVPRLDSVPRSAAIQRTQWPSGPVADAIIADLQSGTAARDVRGLIRKDPVIQRWLSLNNSADRVLKGVAP